MVLKWLGLSGRKTRTTNNVYDIDGAQAKLIDILQMTDSNSGRSAYACNNSATSHPRVASILTCIQGFT